MTFDFEIEGKTHSLYFGMVHKQIVETLSVQAVENNVIIDDFTGLVFLVHAGSCNYNDTMLTARPDYKESYKITEKLAKFPDVVERLYETWKECEAGKDLIRQLPQPTTETGKKKRFNKKKATDWNNIKIFAFGELKINPKEWALITHRDYVITCIGYFNRKRDEAINNRRLWYAIVQGWADPKKLPPIEKAWRIEGEKIAEPPKVTQEDVIRAFNAMQNFGKNRKKVVN